MNILEEAIAAAGVDPRELHAKLMAGQQDRTVALARAFEDAGTDAAPMSWTSFATFWQLTADMMVAGSTPAGHGQLDHMPQRLRGAPLPPQPGPRLRVVGAEPEEAVRHRQQPVQVERAGPAQRCALGHAPSCERRKTLAP